MIYALIENGLSVGTLVAPDDDDFYLEPPVTHTLTLIPRPGAEGSAFAVLDENDNVVGEVRLRVRNAVERWVAMDRYLWSLESTTYLTREDAVCAVANHLAAGERKEGES